MSNRIHVVLSDKELSSLDTLSKDLCLNRSQTIRKMIADGKISQPVYISNKDIIELINNLDIYVKSLIVKDSLEGDDVILLIDTIENRMSPIRITITATGRFRAVFVKCFTILPPQ